MYFLFNTMIFYVWSPALGSQKHGVPLLFCVLLGPMPPAADLDWIAGPGYSSGGYILEKNHEKPTWNN